MKRIDRDELRAVVREELRELLASALAPTAGAYSDRRGHEPPGWSPEGWKPIAPTIPGAYRPNGTNGKPGRWWIVPRAAFEAWERTQASTPPLPARAANDRGDEAWSARAALESVGLRRTR